LSGKKVLVTAGPTYESIDPVRFIGNHSSGKMGIAIAEEMQRRGAEVILVLGPSSITVSNSIKVIRVTSATEMYNACLDIFSTVDIAVMSAAVADYTPVSPSKQKIKKKEAVFSVELAKTKDILKTLGEQKKSSSIFSWVCT
jgi:phosphopantothenoylcysteine decarboxylase/phosphopantothenate--cysteine ligase